MLAICHKAKEAIKRMLSECKNMIAHYIVPSQRQADAEELKAVYSKMTDVLKSLEKNMLQIADM